MKLFENYYEDYDDYQNRIEHENEQYEKMQQEEEWKWELADRYNDDAKCMANFDEISQND